jgi:hypothetical protein
MGADDAEQADAMLTILLEQYRQERLGREDALALLGQAKRASVS